MKQLDLIGALSVGLLTGFSIGIYVGFEMAKEAIRRAIKKGVIRFQPGGTDGRET